VGHEQVTNFIQLASIFVFMPYDLINWVCVGPNTSDTYKAINFFYKKTFDCQGHSCQDISKEDAKWHFAAAVQHIGANVSWNFTSAIADNILSILYAEFDGVDEINSSSGVRDVVFLQYHRDGKLHHHQYRWKMDTLGKAYLQYLAVTEEGTIVPHGVSLFEVNRDGSGECMFDISSYWTEGHGRNLNGGISHSASYQFTLIYEHRMQGLA
jgi:hypothetical protein